jgi:hypothetical protein
VDLPSASVDPNLPVPFGPAAAVAPSSCAPVVNSSRFYEHNHKRQRRKRKNPDKGNDDPTPTPTPPPKGPQRQQTNDNKRHYIHSMVRTCVLKMLLISGEEVREEIVIPPAQMQMCTGPVVGATLMAGLKEYLFNGNTFRAWIRDVVVGVFSSVCMFFHGDSATANIWTISIMLAAMQAIGNAYGVVVYAWFEPCALHQVSRIMVSMLATSGLTAAMYATSRSLLSKRNQTRLEKALRLLAEQMVWLQQENPPASYTCWNCKLTSSPPSILGSSPDANICLVNGVARSPARVSMMGT